MYMLRAAAIQAGLLEQHDYGTQSPLPSCLYSSFKRQNRALFFLIRVKHPHAEQLAAEMAEVSNFLPSQAASLFRDLLHGPHPRPVLRQEHQLLW